MRADKRKYHFTYKVTCIPTGRFYYGMHSTNDLEDGYKGSGKILWFSIRKYGIHNHKFEILQHFNSRIWLAEAETNLIDEGKKNTLCMNLNRGGEGGWDYVNENKLSPSLNRKVISDDVKRRMKEGSIKGAKKLNEWRKQVGAVNGFLGKHHSAERNKKAGDVIRQRVIGSKNGSYGTVWVTKDGTPPQRIQKEQLESFLLNGWRKGRK